MPPPCGFIGGGAGGRAMGGRLNDGAPHRGGRGRIGIAVGGGENHKFMLPASQ